MPIFRSRTPSPDPHAQPLLTDKSAAAWFRQLPTVDAIGRQQIVMRAIETAFRSGGELEFEQVAVIEFLDAELATDCGRLITQYVEHAQGSVALANRIWRAAYEICQGFIAAYRSLLDRALGAANDRRWKQAIPPLVARLIHFYGTDATLRVLKNEPWIPAKWIELHRLYRRAIDLGIERAPLDPDPAGSGAARPTVEHEYLAALLTHLLNTGTLAPREIDWAAAQVRSWAAALELDEVPRTPHGFVVDLGGKRGLVRRSRDDSGAMLRYVDTGPLTGELDRAIAAQHRLAASGPESGRPVSRQRVAILERLRSAVAPEAPAAVPREPRTGASLAAQVRTGLPQICHELAPGDMQNSAIEVAAGLETPVNAGDEAGTSRRSIGVLTGAPFGERTWRVEDRSATGLRIVAPAGQGQHVALGMLVAIRAAGDDHWVLGAVRRVVRPTSEKTEAGVSIIASRVIAVALHAKHQAREDMGFVVDGVDVSTIGERFDGLYLPPPSRPGRPPAAKTLVIPTSEYGEGRNIVLITTRTVYTVALRQPLERHPDWAWVAIDIVDRTARD